MLQYMYYINNSIYMLTDQHKRNIATSVVRVNIYYEYLNNTLDLHNTQSPKNFLSLTFF